MAGVGAAYSYVPSRKSTVATPPDPRLSSGYMSPSGTRRGGEGRCRERVSSSEKAGPTLGLTSGPQGCLLCAGLCLSNITAQRH